MTDYRIIDLHCDMAAYLEGTEGAAPDRTEDIGCAIPYLKLGKVKLQVMAVYTAPGEGSTERALRQIECFERLCSDYERDFFRITTAAEAAKSIEADRIGIVPALESGSGFAEDGERLDNAFRRLEEIIDRAGRLLYISLTHFMENRFGGGNATRKGITDDGMVLLEYLDGRGIAIDLAHTSDHLAGDIFNHMEKKGLDLPVMASHTGMRAVYDVPRNLPDEFALEIIKRRGLIGIAFLRAMIDPHDPSKLLDHIQHCIGLGGEMAVAFGADYFCTRDHPDPSRIPFYFQEHANAGRYPDLMRILEDRMETERCLDLAHVNALRFISEMWSKS